MRRIVAVYSTARSLAHTVRSRQEGRPAQAGHI